MIGFISSLPDTVIRDAICRLNVKHKVLYKSYLVQSKYYLQTYNGNLCWLHLSHKWLGMGWDELEWEKMVCDEMGRDAMGQDGKG